MLNDFNDAIMNSNVKEVPKYENNLNDQQEHKVNQIQISASHEFNPDSLSLELENSNCSPFPNINENITCFDDCENILMESKDIDNKMDSSSLDHNEKRYQKKPFTSEEDKLLLSLVTSIGEKNWAIISMMMKQMNFNRNGRQCRDRYYHYLDPKINNDIDWQPEEDELLMKTVELNGKKWKWMETIFPGRTEVSLRNRYHLILRKRMKKENKKSRKHPNVMPSNFDFLNNYMPSSSSATKPLKLTSCITKPQTISKKCQIVHKTLPAIQTSNSQNMNLPSNDQSILKIFNDPNSFDFDEDFNDLFNINGNFYI